MMMPALDRIKSGWSRRLPRARWLAAALLIVAAGGPAGPAGAGSLWSDESVNLFSNHKAMHVGDIVTVIIVENSSASNQSQTKLSKETNSGLSGSGAGELDFIKLFSASMDYSKEHQGKGQTSLTGSMKAQLTAEVMEIRPNGNLVIEGSRLVQINDDVDEITLRGVIRSEDIAADNTVLSTFLSEAQIAYTGSGPNKNAGRQGLIGRILDLIF